MDSVILPELPTYLFAPNVAGVLSLALTVLLPIAAAMVMRPDWSAGAKGVVLLVLAAVKAFAEAWLVAVDADVAFNATTAAYAVTVNFGIAVAMHFGLLRDTRLQQAALRGGLVRGDAAGGDVRAG
ncbi:hypothetical protein E1211_28975 [Micromonospora sp. 15K316]|uniref:hypothetical protein n=1 Tax=Micromonospora sp. 15K316 TaxID=2530376 RepID=UPI00104E90AF|nr:hypothetical protein [Micromonospora sp. 15K316]TDC27656.1 hypothetical protein E1211_28975 [Micromonospora sp. 15K316]